MKRIGLLVIAMLASIGACIAHAEFKCIDEKGRTHIGDTPPPGCANVVMYEITPTGRVLRRLDPTPTPEQMKAKQEEFERNKSAMREAADQKRKDQALLNTFSSEKEFDVVLDRNLDPLKSRIKMANERMKAVDKRLQGVEEEMEFYKAGKSKGKDKGKGKEMPPQLTTDQQNLKNEHATLEKSIAKSEKEIEDLKTKFEIDKKRWLALKSGTQPGDDIGEAKSVSARPAETVPATKPVKKN